MAEALPDVADLLPHQPPMRLLDRVTAWRDGGTVEASVTVSPDAAFYQRGIGVPAWIGVEYLGQAAALAFGLAAREEGGAPRPGMLVACRRFETALAAFPDGSTLTVRAWPGSALTGPLVRFTGEIHLDGAPVATGEVSVYLADSLERRNNLE